MKKLSLIGCFLFLLSITILFGCTKPTIYTTYTISYSAGSGGRVVGNLSQIIKEGDNSSEVIAIADVGFLFSHWSDGVTSASRQDINITANHQMIAYFIESYTITYNANLGGSVVGNLSQIVKEGNNSSEVIAIADVGFLFAGWSDNKMSEVRTDKNLQADISVTANFVSKVKTLNYEYNGANSGNSVDSITLNYNNLNLISFVVPQKNDYVFGGWYLDPSFTIKVTDETGFYYYGRSIFFNDSNTLYAKWNEPDVDTYKILIVFVEEVYADTQTSGGELVNIEYCMPLIERKILEMIPMQIQNTLNEWFDGIVNFKVDAYFTRTPLCNEYFPKGENGYPLNYKIMANEISEVGPLLKNYRNAIVTFSMNDYYDKLHNIGGGSGDKYACINMETVFGGLVINNESLDSLFDISHIHWYYIIDLYLHEFTHTIDEGIKTSPTDILHQVLGHYGEFGPTIEGTRLFLLGQAKLDGETVGIPIEYWQNKLDVQINYLPNVIDSQFSGGKVILLGDTEEKPPWENAVYLKIPFGSNYSVEAIPREGYRFSHWSDGVTTAIRHDTNIISRLDVVAIFVAK